MFPVTCVIAVFMEFYIFVFSTQFADQSVHLVLCMYMNLQS